jgi:hypothetical protein
MPMSPSVRTFLDPSSMDGNASQCQQGQNSCDARHVDVVVDGAPVTSLSAGPGLKGMYVAWLGRWEVRPLYT